MDIVIDRSHWPKLQQGLEARHAGFAASLRRPYAAIYRVRVRSYLWFVASCCIYWVRERLPGELFYIFLSTQLLNASERKTLLNGRQAPNRTSVIDKCHGHVIETYWEAAEFFGGRRYLFGVDQWEVGTVRLRRGSPSV